MCSVLLLVNVYGKKRLSHLYTEEQRRKLIVFFFERLLSILDGRTIYVATTGDLPKNNYTIIADKWKDINKVIERARKMIKDDLLILPCDLPFVNREDIAAITHGKTTLVPSQDGGTNALFLPASVDIETQFGKNSFEKHVAMLKCKNVEYDVYTSDNFRDIDTEEDIVWALEHRKDSAFATFLIGLTFL